MGPLYVGGITGRRRRYARSGSPAAWLIAWALWVLIVLPVLIGLTLMVAAIGGAAAGVRRLQRRARERRRTPRVVTLR